MRGSALALVSLGSSVKCLERTRCSAAEQLRPLNPSLRHNTNAQGFQQLILCGTQSHCLVDQRSRDLGVGHLPGHHDLQAQCLCR
ncbi:unnamed protein product [Pylaiella littoralis]